MTCPVCGHPEPGDACARCGTDLRALLGKNGAARLEIAPITREPRPSRR